MGGKKPWHAADWQSDGHASEWSSYGSRWQLWSGAKSVASPKGRIQYDQMALPDDGKGARGKASGKGEEAADVGEGYGMIRDVQRAATTARKADIRVRKLQEEKDRKDAQWLLYKRTQKEEFLRQKARYEAALLRIEKDMREAKSAGQEAVRAVQEIAAGERPVSMEVTGDKDNAWEEMIAEEDARRAAAAQLLQATLAHLPQGFGIYGPDGLIAPPSREDSTAPAAPVVPATTPAIPTAPVQGVHGPPVYTAAHSGQPVTSGVHAPFQPSSPHPARAVPLVTETPGESRVTSEKTTVRTSPLHPGQRDLAMPRQPTSEAPPRANIKEATKPTRVTAEGLAGPSLADKLTQARAEALHAQAASDPAMPGVPTAIHLEDDDLDEDPRGDQAPQTSLNHLS
eukprot:s6703_g2.t1